jgi:hypothetical protein
MVIHEDLDPKVFLHLLQSGRRRFIGIAVEKINCNLTDFAITDNSKDVLKHYSEDNKLEK